ncbi:hypothetical protein [Serinicoccus marinus]|uniref:hypothetical protein n=1 Tax=Serinicoccus marinus TaxID=247333 RepID=UPI002490815A|nr:hypothetical protein [Serinicoccus marinus]
MRGISREILARDAAWTLADGNCKDLTQKWGAWEATYLAAATVTDRARALIAPVEVCVGCPITAECADLAELSGYTGIAGGRAYRNGRPDTYGLRNPDKTRRPA